MYYVFWILKEMQKGEKKIYGEQLQKKSIYNIFLSHLLFIENSDVSYYDFFGSLRSNMVKTALLAQQNLFNLNAWSSYQLWQQEIKLK